MTHTLVKSPDYAAWLCEMKVRIRSAHLSVARAVNRDMILLYWDIGRGILEKQEEQGWGKSVVDRLAADLRKEFPHISGFSARNLWDMRRLVEAYSNARVLAQAVQEIGHLEKDEFLRQPVAELENDRTEQAKEFLRQLVAEIPWGHNLLILNKISDFDARLYYLRATAQFGWTRNVLLNQIKAGAYQRSLAEGKTHNFPSTLPEHLAEQAEEALKSSYNLEFALKSKTNPIGVAEYQLQSTLPEELKGKLPTSQQLREALGLS